jgi:L-threonylcarbamoyladenylate synthase
MKENAIMNPMKTKIVEIQQNKLDYEAVKEAGKVLLQGGLVALPTETVYGLGANGLDEKGARKTYQVKGRPSDNPLIIHIAKKEDLDKIVINKPYIADLLAEEFWPGPLTMILEKSPIVPLGITGGQESVAIRMPNHLVALAIIEAGGGFITAPSANTSGRPSPTSAAHVLEDLDGKIEMIVDGGNVTIGLESTILDLTVTPPVILRPGEITPSMLEDIIGEVQVGPSTVDCDSTEKPKAPGMKYRHYAPKGKLAIVRGELEEEILAINKLVADKLMEKKKVGIIATEETVNRYKDGVIKNIGSRKDLSTIAANLYGVLREFDQEQVEYIFSESIPETGIGDAIRNRLDKAAGHCSMEAKAILNG